MKKRLLLAAIAFAYSHNGSTEWMSLPARGELAESALQGAELWFFGGYVLVTVLFLPVARLLTLMGDAVFGPNWGLLLVSFACSLGAALAFLRSRTLRRDWLQSKFGENLSTIHQGFIKVITRKGSDRILGVTMAGYQAGELSAEWVLAMKHNLSLNKMRTLSTSTPPLTIPISTLSANGKKPMQLKEYCDG
jgi:Pyridine nucleotide-disulphide oxidoreductase, dimerisation domain